MMRQVTQWLFKMCAVPLAAGFIFSFMPVAYAGETEVHGYGYQTYLKSNKNSYLDGKEGTWANNEVALQFSNHIADDTTAWVQFAASSEGFEFDWAFIDYLFTNEFSGRIGQVKFPIGLYNEIRDNKMLHLTMMEPGMYREEVDIVFESYRGVGLNYNGPLTVDLFGGAPVMEEEVGVALEVKNLAGGRLTYKTPLEGLTLMGSYAEFSEEQFDAATGVALFDEGSERLTMVSVSYERGGLDVKAEYAVKKGVDENLSSYYIEAGYTFAEKLTPYVMYDVVLNKEDGVDTEDPANYQKETVVGLSYKVNPQFGLKAEQHFISGYLLPAATGEIDPAAAPGEKTWTMTVVGMNFMF